MAIDRIQFAGAARLVRGRGDPAAASHLLNSCPAIRRGARLIRPGTTRSTCRGKIGAAIATGCTPSSPPPATPRRVDGTVRPTSPPPGAANGVVGEPAGSSASGPRRTHVNKLSHREQRGRPAAWRAVPGTSSASARGRRRRQSRVPRCQPRDGDDAVVVGDLPVRGPVLHRRVAPARGALDPSRAWSSGPRPCGWGRHSMKTRSSGRWSRRASSTASSAT
jgi:hypothetical protein